MELKKWIAQAFDEDQPVPVPDHDSTLANFDELEGEQEATEIWQGDHLVGSHGKINDRLAALEAKVDAPGKQTCKFTNSCERYPCGHIHEGREGCYIAPEPPDTCKKADAPEKQKQEAELRLRCIGCGKEGVCSQERSKICDLGGHGHPRCYRFKTPPAICGNCRKAARWDDSAYWVVCYVEDGELKLKSMLCPACPHYERRKA